MSFKGFPAQTENKCHVRRAVIRISFDSCTASEMALPSLAALAPTGAPPAPDLLDQLPPELLYRVVSFVGCEEKWESLCKTDTRLAEICRDEQFWEDLCVRHDWHREDRTTGWHDMTGMTWRQQYFKWCKLRFGPYSEGELLRIFPTFDVNARLNVQRWTNEAGLMKLKDVVEEFLAQTDGTGVLDKPPESYLPIVQQYGPMNTWDVSRVTDLTSLFQNKQAFNAYIGKWNTSNVTNIGRMFQNASAFNNGAASGEPGNPLEWDVSKVTSMGFTFLVAKAFNADIGDWKVSNVTDMLQMFAGASAFNRDIGGWDTSKVADMRSMFQEAIAFNQDLRRWNVSNVGSTPCGSFSNMFRGATAFDQNLEDWNQPERGRIVKKEASKWYMFGNSGLSKGNRPSWSTNEMYAESAWG